MTEQAVGTEAVPAMKLANQRKAYASRGDDVTLTRWIPEPGRHARPPFNNPMPADATNTRFQRRVLPVAAMAQLLVSGHSNVKIGRDVRKGALRGYYIYTLSLEERTTCPASCQHWRDCYGNNMPFAKRIDHRDAAFLPRLADEIAQLLAVRGRKGILIRLHALGDFYDHVYVDFWRERLRAHPRLAVFGYTAHAYSSHMGQHIAALNQEFGHRAMIRFSNGGLETMSTRTIDAADACPPGTVMCPEQTGRTRCCATCAVCWSTSRNVAFLRH